eukprot:m.125359 g.125359  ORF g.125359 m.125359 type:complete len:69 (+) comp37869_c0_seq1:3343-3549(+)
MRSTVPGLSEAFCDAVIGCDCGSGCGNGLAGAPMPLLWSSESVGGATGPVDSPSVAPLLIQRFFSSSQ